MSEATAEALDRFLQDGYIEELSSDLIDKFAVMNEDSSLQCIEKMKSMGKKNMPVAEVSPVVEQYACGVTDEMAVNEVAGEQENGDFSQMVEPVEEEPALNGSMEITERIGTASNAKIDVDFGLPNPMRKTADEAKVKELLNRTGYALEIKDGMRRYGGPPPGMPNKRPEFGSEIFLNNVPRDVYEDTLVPFFETAGKIWEMRIMTREDKQNRGIAFVTYLNKDAAKEAVQKFQKYEVRPRHRIYAQLAVKFDKIHVKNIPKDKTKEELKAAFSPLIDDLLDVIFASNRPESTHNAGYCFLVFDSYYEASQSLKKFKSRDFKVPGFPERLVADWGIPTENPDDDIRKNTKSVRIITFEMDLANQKELMEKLNEEVIKEAFCIFGEIEKQERRNRKIIVHFKDNAVATKAADEMNGETIADVKIDVKLDVPLAEYAAKKQTDMRKGHNRGNQGYNRGRNNGPMQQNRGGGGGGRDAREMIGGGGGRDSREMIGGGRPNALAGRLGGPTAQMGPGGGASSRLGGGGPPGRPSGDIREQLGAKRKMPPPHHAPPHLMEPQPMMRPPVRRTVDEGMYMARASGPSEEALMMEELMALRRKNEALSRSLTMEATPPKRMYSGASDPYSSSFAMAEARSARDFMGPSRGPPARDPFMRPAKPEPSFYEDDPYSLPSFGSGRSAPPPAIRERRELLVGGNDRYSDPAPIERKVVAPPKPMMRSPAGGRGGPYGMENPMENIRSQYGGPSDMGGFSGGFTGRMGRGGMSHSQIPPTRMGGGAAYTRF